MHSEHLRALLIALVPMAAALAQAPASPEQIKAAVERLEAAFRGSEEIEQVEAIEESAGIVDPRVVELVARGLRSRSIGVRDKAIDTLGRTPHPDALKALHGLYRDDTRLRENEDLLADLLTAIGRHGDKSSAPLLAELSVKHLTVRSGRARIMGLARIRHKSAIDGLIQLARKAGPVRRKKNVETEWSSKFRPHMRAALVILTGQDFEFSRPDWRKWWYGNKQTFEVSPERPQVVAEVSELWERFWNEPYYERGTARHRPPWEADKTEGQKTVEELSARIVEVERDLAKAKEELQQMLSAHDGVTHNQDRDVNRQFSQFNRAFDRLETRFREIGEGVGQVEPVATDYFSTWEAKLRMIRKEDLQRMARQRMGKTKAVCDEFVDLTRKAMAAYEPMSEILRSHKAHWCDTLNTKTAAELGRDDGEIEVRSSALHGAIDAALNGARRYEEAVTARTTPTADAPPRAERGKAPKRAPLGAPFAPVRDPTPEQVAEAVDALRVAYKDDDESTRIEAIETHGAILDKEVIHWLARGLRDKSPRVRTVAVEILGWTRHPEALKQLHRMYRRENKVLANRDEALFAALLKAIGRHGDKTSADVLMDNPFSGLTLATAKARLLGLGNIRTNKSLETLMKGLRLAGGNPRRSRRYGEPRFMEDFRLALAVLTGEDLGDTREAWEEWWRGAKRKFRVSKERPAIDEALRRRWEEYWREPYDRG